MRSILEKMKHEMQTQAFWEDEPLDEAHFKSTLPFSIDTMSALQWLQWVFIPKMEILLDNDLPLPKDLLISPYFEEALKEMENIDGLLNYLRELEQKTKFD